jgi:hypothetical protein
MFRIVWLLTNIDFAKEGVPILIAAILGFIIFLVNRTLAGRRAELDGRPVK